MPKARKRSRAAANSPAPADIGDDANGRSVNSELLFYGLITLFIVTTRNKCCHR